MVVNKDRHDPHLLYQDLQDNIQQVMVRSATHIC